MFVALTGYGQTQDRVISRTAGFDHHRVKPAPLDRLLHLLAATPRVGPVSAPDAIETTAEHAPQ